MYKELNESQKRDIRMYGCTEAELRESVEDCTTFKFGGPAMMAASIMSDAQEMLSFGGASESTREQVRQMLNQSKWILFTYVMNQGE
jgi:hypothetical protein